MEVNLTAEIAILNKYAVAMAADSAVTISLGGEQQKIYDSADKLFELSRHNPIGIMVFSGAQITNIPLPILIHKFRESFYSVKNVQVAANEFLKFLQKIGSQSSIETLSHELYHAIYPILKQILDTSNNEFIQSITSSTVEPDVKLNNVRKTVIDRYLTFFKGRPPATFVDGKSLRITVQRRSSIRNISENILKNFTSEQIDNAIEVVECSLQCNHPFNPSVGIVIAGYGEDDLFPTLVSYNLSGMPFGKMKVEQTELIDVDRNGIPARVLPFAQKEMVDRFLYGLDIDIETKIINLLENTIPDIKNQLINLLNMPEVDRKNLIELAENAEMVFFNRLKSKHFAELRVESRAEIESMVEFMPKPEMANMAEALVNLTSIKRRVSRGMETVGGPIDVAVISKSEGFVWVKRKHYFPPELNTRYFERVSSSEKSYTRR